MRSIYTYLFIGLAIALLVVLFGSREALDFSTGQMAAMVYLLLMLVLVGRGAFGSFQGKTKQVFEAVGLWLGLITLIAVFYVYKADIQYMGRRVVDGLQGKSTLSSSANEVSLQKSGAHFTADISINGKAAITFLVDTGATTTTLSFEDAKALGFPVELLTFDIPTNTANGRAFSAAVTLDNVRLGSIEMTKVKAHISEKGRMKGSLLGMSFLERLKSYSVEGDRMLLRGGN